MNKFVLNIIGPSCSGKSTLSDLIGERHPGAYLVAYDKLKWQLYGYHRDKDKDTIKKLLDDFYELVCRQGISIIHPAYFKGVSAYEHNSTIATKEGYRVYTIALTAPREILLDRFRNRVRQAAASKGRISITDESVFLDNLAKLSFLPPGTPVFDTSVMSPQEIATKVEAFLAS